jgi:hypothetical protein
MIFEVDEAAAADDKNDDNNTYYELYCFILGMILSHSVILDYYSG